MRFGTVVCLDDLLRESYWPAKEFMYDLVRAPVHLAGGIDIAKSPRMGQRSNLRPGFEAERFLALVGLRDPAQWARFHHRIPDAAADYLMRHVPADGLVLSYEMPPWMRGLLDAADIAYLDLRISPLRFASDLYMGFATNRPELHEAVRAHAVGEAEVLAEACLMAAKVRYRRRYLPENLRLSGRAVYIGQTREDTALVDGQGRCARIEDVAAGLCRQVGGLELLYKPHPFAGAFAEEERARLGEILRRPVGLCELDTYDLLAGDDDVVLTGLSSGVLQEATWFGKQAHALLPPVCRPGFGADHDPGQHLLVASHEFLSEPLWASILGTPRREGALRLPPQPNRLRELHNTWWGYASHAVRDSVLHKEAFELSGGARLDRAVRDCQVGLAGTRADLAALGSQVQRLCTLLGEVLAQVNARPQPAPQPASHRPAAEAEAPL